VTLKAPDMGCAGDGPDAPGKRRRFGRIAAGIALGVLCFALLWYNVLDPSIRKTAPSPKLQATHEAPAGGNKSPRTEQANIVETEPDSIVETEMASPVETKPTTTVKTEPDITVKTVPAGAVETESSSIAKAESASIGEIEPTGTVKANPNSATETEAASTREEKAQSDSFVSTAPIGHEEGQQLEDFTATCYDGSTFHLADMKGKVVFINLWATYCTPCVHELPYFSDLYQEHEGDVAILAVHSSLVAKDDPEEFIADKGYAMPFTTDTKDNAIFNIVGGSPTLPQTIVLNRKGEVIYNQVKSITPETLNALYEKAAGH
jgi:thiol-disulfide isomerase/thioredoxin